MKNVKRFLSNLQRRLDHLAILIFLIKSSWNKYFPVQALPSAKLRVQVNLNIAHRKQYFHDTFVRVKIKTSEKHLRHCDALPLISTRFLGTFLGTAPDC